ncbi:MAG: hypothetical protein COA37_13605 [Hoeflea sp.]|uniref:hypothetical protein n=1 Tax=Hoeflea sp. TaxID=1940281 RepID=UPI000C0F2DB5|nr:hypothetical protein [Hoeflea sp.]PHR21998.1 MAG: hypothetical protein COA37_13605 [Hoeflea sp.]
MLEIERTPLETITEFRSNIISLDCDMLLSGFALFIEPDQASVRPKTDEIVVGVVTDLPNDLKVSDLAEALEEGEAAFLAIIEALIKMVSTSNRPDRRILMDEAMDHLDDFAQLLVRKVAEETV